MTLDRQLQVLPGGVPTNQISTKRGFPVYRTNPSVPATNGIPVCARAGGNGGERFERGMIAAIGSGQSSCFRCSILFAETNAQTKNANRAQPATN